MLERQSGKAGREGGLLPKEITWAHSIKQERENLGQKGGLGQGLKPSPEFLRKAAPSLKAKGPDLKGRGSLAPCPCDPLLLR